MGLKQKACMGSYGVPCPIHLHQWPNLLSRGINEPPLPPCPNHPLRSRADRGIQAQEVPSLAISQALEVAIPVNMTPFHLNVGDIKRVYKC